MSCEYSLKSSEKKLLEKDKIDEVGEKQAEKEDGHKSNFASQTKNCHITQYYSIGLGYEII